MAGATYFMTDKNETTVDIAVESQRTKDIRYERLKRKNKYPNITQAILYFIYTKQLEEFTTPSIREIQEHFHFSSPRSVSNQLDNLEEQGYITRSRDSQLSRNIRVVRTCNVTELTRVINIGLYVICKTPGGTYKYFKGNNEVVYPTTELMQILSQWIDNGASKHE